MCGTRVNWAGGKALRIHVGLIVNAVSRGPFGCDGSRRSPRFEDGLVDDGEGVVEVAGDFVRRQESAAVAELVGETGGLEGSKEEGAVVAVVELRNPDGAACIEAVEVLVQRGAGRGA